MRRLQIGLLHCRLLDSLLRHFQWSLFFINRVIHTAFACDNIFWAVIFLSSENKNIRHKIRNMVKWRITAKEYLSQSRNMSWAVDYESIQGHFASSIAQHRNCFNCRHHWVAKMQRALIGMWKRLSTWACNQMAISFEERWARGSCGHWMLEDAHHLGNGQTRQLFSIDLFVCLPVPTSCTTSGPLGTMIATQFRERGLQGKSIDSFNQMLKCSLWMQ